MTIIEISTGKKHSVEIVAIESNDFKLIRKDRYFFNWNSEQNQEIYKLQIIGSRDILGLISVEKIPEEWRIHIRLLTVSKENKGSTKVYENIAANLITHIAKIAVLEYAELACVSLKPKTQLAKHYIDKYNMHITGMTLSIEVPEILDLINFYDHE